MRVGSRVPALLGAVMLSGHDPRPFQAQNATRSRERDQKGGRGLDEGRRTPRRPLRPRLADRASSRVHHGARCYERRQSWPTCDGQNIGLSSPLPLPVAATGGSKTA